MRINQDKINRYQAGGPFMVYQPLPIIPPQQSVMPGGERQDAEVLEANGVLDKDLIKDLLGKGLTNDVMAFATAVENAYQQYEQMSDIERNTTYGRKLRSIMKGDLATLNQLARNKALFDTALKKVETNNADSDYAVTRRGVMVKNEETGQLAEVTHEEYIENLQGNSKFRILTNAELVNEREYNPNLINDTKSLEVLNNAVGIRGVKEEVTKILANLGSEKKSLSRDQYLLIGDEKSLQSGAKDLVGMGVNGYYKISQLNENDSNATNIQLAAETMWMNLSDNAKSLLKARAIAQGVDSSELDNAAKEMAISLLSPSLKLSTTDKRTADFDSTMTKAAGGSGGDEAYTDDIGYYQQVQEGMGDMHVMEVDKGNGDTLTLFGFTPGALQAEGKPVGQSSLRNVLPYLGGIIDNRSVSIGGNLVPAHKLDAIVYDGQAAYRVTAPVKVDPVTRAEVPDFDAMEDYNKIMDQLKTVPTASAKESIIRSNGYTPTVNKNGEIVPNVPTQDFLVFDGMINRSDLAKGPTGFKYDSSLLREVTDNEVDIYDALYQTNSLSRKPDKKDFIEGTNYYEFLTDDAVYRGKVFMKLNPGPIAGRNADSKGLNATKSSNTPGYLGSAQQLRAENSGRGTNINYSLPN